MLSIVLPFAVGIALLMQVSCGKEVKKSTASVEVGFSPDDKTLSADTDAKLLALVNVGDSGDTVESGKIYYTLDKTEPTTDSDFVEIDTSTSTESDGTVQYFPKDTIAVTTTTTVKALAVLEVRHKSEKKDFLGQSKTKKKSVTLTSDIATKDYSGKTADATSSSSDAGGSTAASCSSTSVAASNSSQSGSYVIDNSSTTALAQAFSLSTAAQIKSIKLLLSQSGGSNLPASINVSIMANSSNAPTGSALASTTIDTSVLTLTPADYTAIFSSPLSVSASTQYFIVVDCLICTNAIKFVLWASGDNYADGFFTIKNGMGVWNWQISVDSYFAINTCDN